jgi:hypothetical protein
MHRQEKFDALFDALKEIVRVRASTYTLTATAVAALGLLTACSQNVQQPLVSTFHPTRSVDGGMAVFPAWFRPNLLRPAWMKSAPAHSRRQSGIAVAQFGSSSVLWFKANDLKNRPPKVCEPANSTNGIRIDRYGNLWVPDGRANTTTEYAPNCGAAKLTIPDPTGEPADVAFDHSGHVYILNLNDKSGPPTVNVYTAAGKHIRTLSDPSFAVLFGVESDNKGDVFVSNLTSSNHGIVVEFPQGKMPGTQLSGVNLGLPGVPAFDAQDNLVIGDWQHLTIDIFAPPYTGSPSTFHMMGAAIWCPLNHQEQRIYCGDAANGSLDVYAYPSGTYLYSDTAGLSPSALVTGVAPAPPAPN